MTNSVTIIAIDGTFASGKGTLAKKLAHHYGFAYLDTGKLYRAIAHKAVSTGISLEDGKACAKLAKTITLSDLDNPLLKSGPIGANASIVSVHKDVRDALLDFQKEFATNPGTGFSGAVLDGRDIGTVICPDAKVKLYVDADPKVRAGRRHMELVGYGENITFKQVLAQLIHRDTRDTTRKNAPLKPASDAHLLDTTNLSIEAVFEMAKSVVDAVLRKHQN